MTLGSRELYDMMEMFERTSFSKCYRKDREDNSLWSKGVYYQNGALNDIFRAYQSGYSYARSVYIECNEVKN